ncbi:hypothetical protein Tcan_18019 [Toxocara canis]|uniref:Uncharacterized protein n=1 Tax=Toxocara canis TaxID=6265 RepID=A0A0B2VKE1_TOXCA|nr:hypothetical protein Tcan_18019 [Toxocara canis]
MGSRKRGDDTTSASPIGADTAATLCCSQAPLSATYDSQEVVKQKPRWLNRPNWTYFKESSMSSGYYEMTPRHTLKRTNSGSINN